MELFWRDSPTISSKRYQSEAWQDAKPTYPASRRKTTHWNPSPAARAQPACGWQAARLAWELAGSAAARHPRDPRHFLWQQTQSQQNNLLRHLQLSVKSHNTDCGKLAKLFPSLPWDWYFLWLVYCCLDPVKKLFCSRVEVVPHHFKIQRVPVQGFACSRHSLHAVLLQRGSCVMESLVSISALHLTQF